MARSIPTPGPLSRINGATKVTLDMLFSTAPESQEAKSFDVEELGLVTRGLVKPPCDLSGLNGS